MLKDSIFNFFYKQWKTTTCTYIDTIKVAIWGIDQYLDRSKEHDVTNHWLVVTDPS